MDIITGYIGEPHISSEQDRDINIGIVGEGSYVLATGLQMEPEVQTGNEVRIKDGVIMHQGCAASIKKNTYDSVMIANGSQGMKRTDLIVARYQRDAETNIESMNWVVIQGTPAETDPVVPEYVSGDIQAGDTVADMPMYKVHLDGLNITSIEKVFTVVNGLKELNSKLQGLLADPEDIDLALNTSGFTSNSTWAQRVGRQVTVYPQVVGTPVKGRMIASGLPAPPRQIIVRDATFGQAALNTAGQLIISSAGSTSSTYFCMPFTYWAAE